MKKKKKQNKNKTKPTNQTTDKNPHKTQSYFFFSSHILSHIWPGITLKTTCNLLMENWRNFVVVPLKTTFLRENFISAFRIFWFCQKYKLSSLQKACTSTWVLHEHLDSENCLYSWEGEYIAEWEAQESKLRLPWWQQGEKLLQSRACPDTKVVWDQNKMIPKHVSLTVVFFEEKC